MRARVLEETRAFCKSLLFRLAPGARHWSGRGCLFLCRCFQSSGRCGVRQKVSRNKDGVSLIGLGACRLLFFFSSGALSSFRVCRVRCVSDQRGAARVLLFFCSSSLVVQVSCCLSVCLSVRLSVGVSCCHAVQLSRCLSLLLASVAVLLLRSAVMIFCYVVRLSYIVQNNAAFRHWKHLCILVIMTAKQNNVKIYGISYREKWGFCVQSSIFIRLIDYKGRIKSRQNALKCK